MITRNEILARARAVPVRSDDYSQSRLDGDGANAKYRPDCSGWVSYCWGVPTSGPGTWGGYSTSTFVTTDWAPGVKGIMYEIPRSELQPGDAIGHCGPTTSGNGGHIALWLGKSGDREHIIGMPGGLGPVDDTVQWGVSGDHWNSTGNIRAFRFRGVTDAPASGSAPVPVVTATITPGAAFPLAPGNYYGDISGPAESHGGGVAADRPVIAAIQRRLIALGFVPDVAAGTAAATAWSDGEYGADTIAAVKRLQVAHKLPDDGKVGALTWHALFPVSTTPTPVPPVVSTPEPVPTPTPDPVPVPEPTPAPVDMAALAAALAPLLAAQVGEAVATAVASLRITTG